MGSGFKDWSPGDVLTAADVDGYLMRQTVMTFADASARDTALSGVLDEGMMAYLEDTNVTTYYDGSSWEDIRGLGGGSATSPGGFSSGDVLDAADMNALPAGLVAGQSLTTSFSTSSPHTTLQDTGATVTVSEIAGRVYRHSARFNPYPNGGLQGIRYKLLRGGVVITSFDLDTPILSTTAAFPFCPSYVYTSASTGSVVWKWQIQAITANTVVTDFGDSSYIRQYWVEDVQE